MPMKKRCEGGDGSAAKVSKSLTGNVKAEPGTDEVKALVRDVVQARNLLQATAPAKEALLKNVVDRYNEVTANNDLSDYLMKEYSV